MQDRPQSTSDLQFAFKGEAGRVMEQHFLHDAENARLSRMFRVYYRLRPLIPLWLRQKLQKSRGEGMEGVPPDWYIPTAFLKEFTQALRNAIASEPEAAIIHPWPKPWKMCVSLTHDVETIDGLRRVDRLARLEESFGFRSCWNIVPYKYKTDAGFIQDLTARGHEISVHGYNHDGRLFSSKRVFEGRRSSIQSAISDFGAVGFRAPMVHRNLDWILTLGTDYDASCFDVDPFQAMAGGVGSVWPFMKQKMVELPYTLPQDHTLFIALAQNDIAIWKQKIEFLRRWSGMAMLVTHPDYLDTEQRFDLYRQFLEHLKSQTGVWFALPKEITKWWRARSESTLANNATVAGPVEERGQVLRLRDLVDVNADSDDGITTVQEVGG